MIVEGPDSWWYKSIWREIVIRSHGHKHKSVEVLASLQLIVVKELFGSQRDCCVLISNDRILELNGELFFCSGLIAWGDVEFVDELYGWVEIKDVVDQAGIWEWRPYFDGDWNYGLDWVDALICVFNAEEIDFDYPECGLDIKAR